MDAGDQASWRGGRAAALAGLRVREVPPELVAWIAREAIAAYHEQRDWYELGEEAAKAAAGAEVVEGAAVDLDALEAERRAEPEPMASQDALPWCASARHGRAPGEGGGAGVTSAGPDRRREL